MSANLASCGYELTCRPGPSSPGRHARMHAVKLMRMRVTPLAWHGACRTSRYGAPWWVPREREREPAGTPKFALSKEGRVALRQQQVARAHAHASACPCFRPNIRCHIVCMHASIARAPPGAGAICNLRWRQRIKNEPNMPYVCALLRAGTCQWLLCVPAGCLRPYSAAPALTARCAAWPRRAPPSAAPAAAAQPTAPWRAATRGSPPAWRGAAHPRRCHVPCPCMQPGSQAASQIDG